MADYFDQQPNFTNPQYASPEQLAAARAYADVLTKRSGENVNRPAGAAANMLNAFTAALTRNRATQLQQQAAEGNAQNFSDVISQMQNGQRIDPQNLAHIIANPLASPEQRALALRLMTPEAIKSEFGQPGYMSPTAGVQAPPIQPGYTPGYRVEQGAEGVHTNAPVPLTPMPRAPVPASSRVWGDREGEAAGIYPPSTPQTVPNTPMSLDQLAAKGREFAAQKAFTQGGAQTVTNVQNEDIASAANAPTIKRVAGTMLDDLRAHGNQMTFGPSAEVSNNIKRFAANYAPGLMRDQLEGLASADSFDKMSAQLTTLLSKAGGGTDAQLFNNMKSVPGAHNSKEGAEALLKMTIQVADQQQAMRQATAGARNAQEYEALRNDFYARNPIVNPITGNPIKLDMEAQRKNTGSGGFKVLRVY